MWTQPVFTPVVIGLLLLCHFSDTAIAFKISPFQRAPKATAVSQYGEDDLSSLLYTQPVDQEGLFSDALQLLNSMKSSPSCNRMAVTNLITSCQELKSEDQNRMDSTQPDLDYIKSLYAARLAICEVTGAGARFPDECSSLVNPKSSRIFHQGYGADTQDDTAIGSTQLESCLRALESKPQWWTSYSNNRQNAAVMCQAARIEVERDELLNHHMNLVDITIGISKSLNQSLQDSATEAAQQKAFIEAADSMRLKLMQDIQESGLAARGLLQDLVAEIEASLRSSITDIQTNVANAGSDTESLSRDIQSSVYSVYDLKRALNDVHSDAIQRRSELAAAERESLRANSQLALAVQHSLEDIRQQKTDLILEEFGNLHTSLQSLNELVVSVHRSHKSLDERLNHFNRAFQQLEYKAGVLDMMLQWQVTNHSRLQQSLESDMRVAQTLLEGITVSAANLQTTISETYQVVSKIGSAGIALGTIPWWLWTLACLCLVGLLAPKAFAIAFFVCTAVLSTGTIGRLRLLQWPSLDPGWSPSYLEAGCFIIGVALSAAAVVIIVRKGILPMPYIRWTSNGQQILPSSVPYSP